MRGNCGELAELSLRTKPKLCRKMSLPLYPSLKFARRYRKDNKGEKKQKGQ